jgi:subtilisin family serine protease
VTLTQAGLSGRTGRGVSIAIVDSGVHPGHPHIGRIAGGITIDDHAAVGGDLTDRLGHGTAVAAAIHEKAPDAVLVAVKVFDRELKTSGRALVEAIRWAATTRVSIVNLSLGTLNHDHETALAAAVAEAAAGGVLIVAAAPDDGAVWLPAAIAGVIGVSSADLPRDTCELTRDAGGRIHARASGLPRPIPGVPPERNVQGTSFAVANTTGLLALALEEPRLFNWQLAIDN